jgi:Domain of unknown function (DUF1707)
MGTPAAGDGRLRASHTDRERAVDILKVAFVQGRLTRDELDARVGQALAARTYADLAALTANLPAEPDRAPAPARVTPPAPVAPPARAHPRNREAKRAVKIGAGIIGAIVLTTMGAGVATDEPAVAVALPILIVLFTAVATAFVAALIAVALKVESRRQNRSRGQLPPGPVSGADDPASAGAPPADPARRRPRRPPGSLAVWHAG